MAQSIWERFDIDPSYLEDANLVGVDNGAGNCCAVNSVETFGKQIKSHLYFDESHNEDKLFTVCSFSQTQTIVGEEAISANHNNIFVSFKMPPDNEVSEQCYGGNLDNPTYREIMQRFFQTMIERLFRHNAELLKKEHTILFVGRPASPRWQMCELDYQKLLGEGLSERLRQLGYAGTVDVVIYSEAQAALAFEYSEKRIRDDEIVLIIDCGSSTFDAVLVHGHRIVAEHSRQLGAGMIEKLMFDMVLAQGNEDILRSVDAREAMHRDLCAQLVGVANEGALELILRKKKELFFGAHGNDQNDQFQKISLAGNGKTRTLKSVIDEDFMHQVIHEIPVRIQDSEIAEGGYACFETTDYPSFYEATSSFMRGARTKCDAAGVMPDRVVLTGGASVMPFIEQLVRAVFGADSLGEDATVSNPVFSVGEGLAFMGYIEIQKYRALKELKKQVAMVLDSCTTQTNISRLIREPFADALWDSIVKDFQTWSTSDRLGTTLHDGIVGEGFSVDVVAISQGIQQKLSEAGGLFQTIQEVINKYFAQLFPQKSAFVFHIESDFLGSIIYNTDGLCHVIIKRSDLIGIFSGLLTPMDEPLPIEKRKSICNRILSRKHQNLEGLRSQLEASAVQAAKQLLKAMRPQIEEELAVFIDEKVTPYFVEDFTV